MEVVSEPTVASSHAPHPTPWPTVRGPSSHPSFGSHRSKAQLPFRGDAGRMRELSSRKIYKLVLVL